MDTEGQIVREILHQNEFLLRRHMVLSRTVLDHLKAEGLLLEASKRKIMIEPPHRQVGSLIQSLEYKGLSSMKKFLDILRQTGHGWLADNLMDTDISMDRLNRPKPDTSSLRYRDSSTASDNSAPARRLAEYRQALKKSYDRTSVTAGHDSYSATYGVENRGRTLASLLKARDPQPENASRGFINTRDLLSLQSGAPPLYPDLGHVMTTNQSNHRPTGMTRALHDVPSTLYDLNQAFATQEQQNQQAINILQQEETAIRQLLEQNARDQGQIRRKQAVVTDISHRLQDIHVRANEAYEPTTHPNVGRYRLSQLNQIPWSGM